MRGGQDGSLVERAGLSEAARAANIYVEPAIRLLGSVEMALQKIASPGLSTLRAVCEKGGPPDEYGEALAGIYSLQKAPAPDRGTPDCEPRGGRADPRGERPLRGEAPAPRGGEEPQRGIHRLFDLESPDRRGGEELAPQRQRTEHALPPSKWQRDPNDRTHRASLLETFQPPDVALWETAAAFFGTSKMLQTAGLERGDLPCDDTDPAKIWAVETHLRSLVDLIGHGWLPAVKPVNLDAVRFAAADLHQAFVDFSRPAGGARRDPYGAKGGAGVDAPVRASGSRDLPPLSDADKRKALGASTVARLRALDPEALAALANGTGVQHMPKNSQRDLQRVLHANSKVNALGMSVDQARVPHNVLLFKDNTGHRAEARLRKFCKEGDLRDKYFSVEQISALLACLQGKPFSLQIFLDAAKAIFGDRHQDSADALLRDALEMFDIIHGEMLLKLNLSKEGLEAFRARLLVSSSGWRLPMEVRYTYAKRVLAQYNLDTTLFLRDSAAPPPSLATAMEANESFYRDVRAEVAAARAGADGALKALGGGRGGGPQQGGAGLQAGGGGHNGGGQPCGGQHGGGVGHHGGGQYGGGGQHGGGLYGGGGGQHGGGRQHSGGAQQGVGQQAGNGGFQSGGGGAQALLHFHISPQGADWAAFNGAIAPLTDGNGVSICRDAVHKGCLHAACKGWHPKRGSRKAKEVLDTVRAAISAVLFDTL